jgi:hypothetical protein
MCGLQCLLNILQSLEAWSKKSGYGPVGIVVPEPNTSKRASKFEMVINVVKVDSEPTDEAKVTTQADDFEKAKAFKVSIEAAVIEVRI